ncbi:MAG: SPOR domain-containing protein [Candidatus Omnitrophica bacterium]|nr:SPOR domain-containing protein [Candidatus Omnitrophota bacterium]
MITLMIQKQIQLEIFDSGRRVKRSPIAERGETEQPSEPKFPTQLCIKIASFLIIAIISFGLGVEHGKIISINFNSVRSISKEKITQLPRENIARKEEIQKPAIAKDAANREIVKEKTISSNEYIIQVATYKKDSSYINKESSRLKQKGYTPVLIPSDNYTQLCAGKFPNKKIATEHLKKLEQTYKDCFIRKI